MHASVHLFRSMTTRGNVGRAFQDSASAPVDYANAYLPYTLRNDFAKTFYNFVADMYGSSAERALPGTRHRLMNDKGRCPPTRKSYQASRSAQPNTAFARRNAANLMQPFVAGPEAMTAATPEGWHPFGFMARR